ncbi:MAG: nitroreductase family protein [Candidatus Woesearchaeota archaeon]
MDVEEAILNRRSIRKFKDIPVPRDKVTDICIAGQFAPSPGNLQNWRFVVIDDEDMKDSIAKACHDQLWIATAPILIVIIVNEQKMETFYPGWGEFYTTQAGAAAAMNMIIRAESLGLATCWVSSFEKGAVDAIIGSPGGFKTQVVIPIGYANEKVPVPAKTELNFVTFLNYGNGRGKVKDDFFFFADSASSRNKTVKGFAKNIKGISKSISGALQKKK